jgi:hypothetical protein
MNSFLHSLTARSFEPQVGSLEGIQPRLSSRFESAPPSAHFGFEQQEVFADRSSEAPAPQEGGVPIGQRESEVPQNMVEPVVMNSSPSTLSEPIPIPATQITRRLEAVIQHDQNVSLAPRLEPPQAIGFRDAPFTEDRTESTLEQPPVTRGERLESPKRTAPTTQPRQESSQIKPRSQHPSPMPPERLEVHTHHLHERTRIIQTAAIPPMLNLESERPVVPEPAAMSPTTNLDQRPNPIAPREPERRFNSIFRAPTATLEPRRTEPRSAVVQAPMPAAERTVHITIGRLEVRVQAPTKQGTGVVRSKPEAKVMGLEEYLSRRNRGAS